MKKRYLVFGVSVFIAGYSLASVPKVLSIWESKISQQHRANMIARNSSELYQSLKNSIMQTWPDTFNSETSVDSLISLNDTINIESSGLKVPTQLLQQPVIEDVSYSNTNIGISLLCVKNSSNGFIVGAPSISQLLRGMKKLESRIDTQIGSYTYINHKGSHQIIMDKFCILLRTSGAI